MDCLQFGVILDMSNTNSPSTFVNKADSGLCAPKNDSPSVKSLSSNSIAYFAANISRKSLSFGLVLVLTRFLSPEQYGIISLLQITSSVLFAIYTMSLIGASSRFFFDYAPESKELRVYHSTILTFMGLIGVLICAAFWITGTHFSEPVFGEITFFPLLAIASLTALFRIPFEYKLNLFRLQEKGLGYSLLSFGYSGATVLFSLAAVAVFRWGVTGKVGADLSVALLSMIIAFVLLRKDLCLKLSSSVLRSSLLYSLPLLPHVLSNFVFESTDRLLLAKLLSLRDVGIYSVATNLALVMALVPESVRMAYAPFFHKTARSSGENAKRLFSVLTTQGMLAYVLVGLVLILFSQDAVRLIVGKAYHGSAGVIVPLIVANVFRGFYFFLVMPLLYVKKATRYVSIATISAGIANAILNFVLINRFGIYGAAWATVVATILHLSIILFYAQRVYRIPYQWGKIATIIVVSALPVTGMLYSGQFTVSLFCSTIIRLGLLAIAVFLLFILRIVDISLLKSTISGFRTGRRHLK